LLLQLAHATNIELVTNAWIANTANWDKATRQLTAVLETKMVNAKLSIIIVQTPIKSEVLEKIAMPVQVANQAQYSQEIILVVDHAQSQFRDKTVIVIHSGMDKLANDAQLANWELDIMFKMIKVEHHVSQSIMLLHVINKTK
jgi:hypothetical protein